MTKLSCKHFIYVVQTNSGWYNIVIDKLFVAQFPPLIEGKYFKNIK